jgi:hypothetical protein
MNFTDTNTSEMLFRGIYNLLRGFSEILTLAVDDRQSIAYLCAQQKH